MSPSGKAAVFGTAISEVRVLPPQNIKDLSLDGSFLTSRNGALSPPSFHSRRSFKRGSTLSGILPRTAHVVRLRCKRVLTTQKLNLSLDGSFLTSRNGVLSPPSFHSRRSFKRGSTLSGILPRTAHAVRLRCKRVLTTQKVKSIVRWVFFSVPEWSPLTSEFSLPQVVQTWFYPVGYPASYGSCCSPTMQASPNHSES